MGWNVKGRDGRCDRGREVDEMGWVYMSAMHARMRVGRERGFILVGLVEG